MLQLDSAMIQSSTRVEALRAEAENERVLRLLAKAPSRATADLGLRARLATHLYVLAVRLDPLVGLRVGPGSVPSVH